MNVTLRIKRTFFDQILSGSKRVEYRSVTPFNERALRANGAIKTLTLHYQDPSRKLVCDVLSVARIKTPKFLKTSGIPFSRETFAIQLARPRLAMA